MCIEYVAALLLVSHDKSVLGQFEEIRDLSEINQVGAWPSGEEDGT